MWKPRSNDKDNPSSYRHSRGGLLGKIIGTAVVILLLAGILLTAVPRIMGGGCYAVVSGSMEPVLSVGDLLLTKPVALREIEEGDLLTFWDPENARSFTHRVVRVESEAQLIYTKGDANELEDPSPTAYQYVAGRVTHVIPLAGYPGILLHSKYGAWAACGVLLLWSVYIIWKGAVGKWKKQTPKTER